MNARVLPFQRPYYPLAWRGRLSWRRELEGMRAAFGVRPLTQHVPGPAWDAHWQRQRSPFEALLHELRWAD